MSDQPTQHAPITRLVLVRHGEAEGNRELRYLGSSDVALTALGRAQATQVANGLRVWPIAALYSSPQTRACATAAAVGAALGKQPIIVPELREEDFGAWELLSRAEVRRRDPELLSAWEASAEIAPPAGESIAAVWVRAIRCADALAARHPGETIALVSHVSPIKALTCAALDLPHAGVMRMWLDPASISVVDWRPGAPARSRGVLRLFNSTAHLDESVAWRTAMPQ